MPSTSSSVSTLPRRKARLLVVALLVSLAVVTPEKGQTLSCDQQALGTSWSTNCWVGYGYDTAANYITGIQRILKGLGFYGGTVDGYWGPLSQGATQNFQADEGLQADGIVGNNTWARLDNYVFPYCGDAGGYRLYLTAGESCVTYSFRRNTTTSLWTIRRVNSTWETEFATWGPY